MYVLVVTGAALVTVVFGGATVVLAGVGAGAGVRVPRENLEAVVRAAHEASYTFVGSA